MARAQAESQVWKGKFGTEAMPRIDDLDNARSKLMVRRIKALVYTSSRIPPA